MSQSKIQTGEVVTADRFLDGVAESGLISEAEVGVNRSLVKEKQLSAERLAKLMVQRKTITEFQARMIYNGKANQLRLGNYILLDKIGAGGMGQVFRAKHRVMDRDVALKILPREMVRNAELVQRFHREVKAVAKLAHPNIVTAYDADSNRGIHYYVMELVEGSDLFSLVKQAGPLSLSRAVDCLVQTADGLDYAHREGMVHRDIKPQNLLLDKTGQVKILDLGLVRMSDPQAAEEGGLTAAGTIMGTVDYMAPEQARDTRNADARSDIYSLGCTLHFLLTGKPPFESDTLVGKIFAHRDSPIPDLTRMRTDLPAAFQTVFARIVAKSPDDRFQTMHALIESLQSYQEKHEADADRTAKSRVAPEDSVQDEDGLRQPRNGESLAAAESPPLEAALVETVVIDPGQSTQVSPPVRPFSKNWMLVVVGCLGVLCLVGVIIRINRPDGQQTVVEVADGSRVTIDEQGNVDVNLPKNTAADSGKTTQKEPLNFNKEPEAKIGQNSSSSDPINSIAAAKALLDLGAELHIRRGAGDPQRVQQTSELPKQNFQVVYLTLRRRDLTTAELKPLALLNELVSVDLSHSGVTDDALAFLADKTSIELLNLQATAVSDAGMRHLAGLTKLRNLSIGQTAVTDKGFAELANLTMLNTLQLQLVKLTDRSAPVLAKMKGLERLYLTHAEITEKTIEVLAELPELQFLVLSGNPLPDESLVALSSLEKLQSLNLDQTLVTNKGLVHLAKLEQLTSLDLGATFVTDEGFVHLGKLSRLNRLSFRGSPLSGNGLVHLAGLPLESLTLEFAKVSNESLASLAPLADTLRSLTLTANPITDGAVDHLATLENLTFLVLTQTQISAAGVQQLRSKLPKTRILAP